MMPKSPESATFGAVRFMVAVHAAIQRQHSFLQ